MFRFGNIDMPVGLAILSQLRLPLAITLPICYNSGMNEQENLTACSKCEWYAKGGICDSPTACAHTAPFFMFEPMSAIYHRHTGYGLPIASINTDGHCQHFEAKT